MLGQGFDGRVMGSHSGALITELTEFTHKAREFNEPLSLTDWKWDFCWRWMRWMDKFTLFLFVSLMTAISHAYYILGIKQESYTIYAHWIFTIILEKFMIITYFHRYKFYKCQSARISDKILSLMDSDLSYIISQNLCETI